MARTTKHGASDSENDSDQPKSTKKSASTSKNASKDSNNHDKGNAEAGEENEGESEEEEEEEFEIESILDAKQGVFEEGRYGYLVKWKGYDEEHNSWVDEKDAGGAQAMIDAYWNIHKKGGRKTLKSATKPNKSISARGDSSEAEEVSAPPAKKRGRPPKSAARGSGDEEEEDTAPKKKPRKSAGGAAKEKNGRRVSHPSGEDEEEGYAIVRRKLKDASTWEHLVESIDTVERSETGTLYVFFTLKNKNGFGREVASLCRQKMPYKLIEFYESHLSWKLITIDDEMEE